MTITRQQLLAIMPGALNQVDTYLPYINKYMAEFDINTPLRVSYFLATIALESAYLKTTEENLNYSADRLKMVFPKYFPTTTIANQYARKPAKIGARVYASRMGNGNEASGEGYKYRGRGLIQLTGKNNYVMYRAYCGFDVVEKPELLAAPLGATRSACWFWKKNGLNELADKNVPANVRKKVNGGLNGINEFLVLVKRAKKVFNVAV